MPHGVLFRGGEEKKIRQNSSNRTSSRPSLACPRTCSTAPASRPVSWCCVRTSPASRRIPTNLKVAVGQVALLSMPMPKFHAGRAQNYLRPEHVEKIVSTFDRFEDVPGYARRCRWRRSQPGNRLESQHPPLRGQLAATRAGTTCMRTCWAVCLCRGAGKATALDALGFASRMPFTVRTNDAAYFDSRPRLLTFRGSAFSWKMMPGVQARHPALRDALAVWWDTQRRGLADFQHDVTSTPSVLSSRFLRRRRFRRWVCLIAFKLAASCHLVGRHAARLQDPARKRFPRRH